MLTGLSTLLPFSIVRFIDCAVQRTMTTKNLCNLIAAGADLLELLDEKEAARFLDNSPGTLSVWRSTGRYNLPFIKIGRNVRYRRADLIAWLEKRTRETGATA
jgi:hypothetical protein